MALLMAERTDRPTLTLFGEDAEDRYGARTPHGDEHGDVDGGPTLDDTIVAAWEGLTAQVAVSCLLCDEGMLRLVPGGAEHGAAGRCDCCGATLA